MHDSVLLRAAVALPRVTPLVMEYELLLRSRALRLWLPARASGDLEPGPARFEAVREAPPRSGRAIVFQAMRHPPHDVGLVVEDPRAPGDRATGNDLAHERDASTRAAGREPPHVEAQVDLLERGARPERHATGEARVLEQEADEAQERAALVEVRLRPARSVRGDDRLVDHVVDDDQVSPARAEQGRLAGRVRAHRARGFWRDRRRSSRRIAAREDASL